MTIPYPAIRSAISPAVTDGYGPYNSAIKLIEGLFSAGQQGFWLPFTDFASLSQDSAGTLPYTALEQPVGRVLDRSGRGNHATQPTSTARGVVSARVNRLIATEALSAATWSASGGATVTDGGAGSSTITFAGGVGFLTQSVASLPAAQNLGATFLLGVIANTSARVLYWGGATAAGTDVVTITPIGGGEWLQTVARTFTTASGGSPQFQINNSAAGNGAVVTVRACSFVFSNQAALPYQRVNTATDYDSAGFTKSLRVEVDDFYTCGGGGSTTGFYYADVIRPMGGAGTARFIMSDRTTGNVGIILQINTSNKLELAVGNTTTYVRVSSAETLDVGTAYWCEALDDGVNLQVRVNNGAPVSVPRPTPTAGGSTMMLYKHIPGNDDIYNGQVTEPIYRAGPPPSAYERSVIRGYQMQKAGL